LLLSAHVVIQFTMRMRAIVNTLSFLILLIQVYIGTKLNSIYWKGLQNPQTGFWG